MPSSNYKCFQDNYLAEPKGILEGLINELKGRDRNLLRLGILERCAAKLGGFDYDHYCETFKRPKLENLTDPSMLGLLNSIKKLDLGYCVTLSILSAEELEDYDQRFKGAFYTDFRLALKLGESFLPLLENNKLPKVIDLACGSGILLSAVVSHFKRKIAINDVLEHCIFAQDLSENAVRATLLSLASMTDNLNAIRKLSEHLVCGDSLLPNSKIKFSFFDGIIGNPPWEKLKLSQHEYLRSNGHDRHYGETAETISKPKQLQHLKDKLKQYSLTVNKWLPNHRGEIDLYMPFISMAFQIVKPGGIVAQIIPASLIRNSNTKSLRKFLFKKAALIRLTIFDNKGKFFKIDSRFKFLFIEARIDASNNSEIHLQYGRFMDLEFAESKPITINLSELSIIRPDLSIPETQKQEDWLLFEKMSKKFPPFGNKMNGWEHKFHRELDMTLDKKGFDNQNREGFIPIIEGRMIHQYRTGIKAYSSGTGRKAIWIEAIPKSKLESQFYIDKRSIPENQLLRMTQPRVGFCDITGQTNERTMLASMVPAQCICGNKVPTIDFIQAHKNPMLSYLWIGIANSFVFDWLIRRIITTNANFFIVDSIPMPPPDFNNETVQAIALLSKEIVSHNHDQFDWSQAETRAKIDAHVAMLYEISFEDFELLLNDFGSIDKNILSPISRSPTKDLALYAFLDMLNFEIYRGKLNLLKDRIFEYKRMGLIPYVPSQFSKLLTPKSSIEWPQSQNSDSLVLQ